MANLPSNIADQAGRLMELVNDLIYDQQHFVVGGEMSDGGMTQSTGDVAVNFDVDTTAILGFSVGGVQRGVVAAGTDIDADAGILMATGQSTVYAVVLQTGAANATAPAFLAIPGTPATTGAQLAPTRAEIEEAVGHANYVIVGDVTVNRTGDTTVTESFDYSRRSRLGTSPLLVTTI